jgi:hypothetical protein
MMRNVGITQAELCAWNGNASEGSGVKLLVKRVVPRVDQSQLLYHFFSQQSFR